MHRTLDHGNSVLWIALASMTTGVTLLTMTGCRRNDPQLHAPESSQQNACLISGIVSDRAGKPVSRARIHLFPITVAVLDAQYISYTRADGTFEVQRDPNAVETATFPEYLFAWAPDGRKCACAQIDRDKQRYHIVLEDGIALSGTVKDAKGNPIAGATVYVTANVPGQPGSDIGAATPSTDTEGTFRVPSVPKGMLYRLSVNSLQYDQKAIDVNLADVSADHVSLEPLILSDAVMSVAGQVLYEDGRPLPRARVVAVGHPRLYHQPFREVNADATGSFKIEGLVPGPVYLVGSDLFGDDPQLRGSVKTAAGDQDVKIVLGVEAPFE